MFESLIRLRRGGGTIWSESHKLKRVSHDMNIYQPLYLLTQVIIYIHNTLHKNKTRLIHFYLCMCVWDMRHFLKSSMSNWTNPSGLYQEQQMCGYTPQTAPGCLGNAENLEVGRDSLILNQRHVLTSMHSHLKSTKQLFQIIKRFFGLRQCVVTTALIKTQNAFRRK